MILGSTFIMALIDPGRKQDSVYIDPIGEMVSMTLVGKKLSNGRLVN